VESTTHASLPYDVYVRKPHVAGRTLRKGRL
jgi:hypothetical protein